MSNIKILNAHKDGMTPDQILDRCRHEIKYEKVLVIGIDSENNVNLNFSDTSEQFVAHMICELQSFYASKNRWED